MKKISKSESVPIPPHSGETKSPKEPPAIQAVREKALSSQTEEVPSLADRLTPLSSVQERKEALEELVKMDANDFFLLKQQQKIWDATPVKPANFYKGNNTPLEEPEEAEESLLEKAQEPVIPLKQSLEQWFTEIDFTYAKERKWVEPTEKDQKDLKAWEARAKPAWAAKVQKWRKTWDKVEAMLENPTDSRFVIAKKIEKIWPFIIERKEEFMFCDDELPELAGSCDTGWEEKFEEVEGRVFPRPMPPHYKDFAQHSALYLRRDLCKQPLQLLVNPEKALNVHTRKAIRSLANSPLQLRYDPARISGEDVNKEILRQDFQKHYPSVIGSYYTNEAILEALKTDFDKVKGGIKQKKLLLAPLFEDYKEALRQNEALSLVPGDKTRKQLTEEAKTLLAKSLPDEEFVEELNKLFRRFREENLAPPFVKRPPPLEEISQKLQKFLPSKERLTLKPNDPEALRKAFVRLFTDREKKKIHITALLKDLSSQNLQELQKLFPSVLDFSAPKALEKAAQELFDQYDQDKEEASKLLEQLQPEELLELEKEYTNALKKNLETFLEGDMDRFLQRNKEFLEAKVLDKSGNITRFGLILWGRLSGTLEETKEESAPKSFLHLLEMASCKTKEDILKKIKEDPSFFWKLDTSIQQDSVLQKKTEDTVIKLLNEHPTYLLFLDERFLENKDLLGKVLRLPNLVSQGYSFLIDVISKRPNLWNIYKEKLKLKVEMDPDIFAHLSPESQSHEELVIWFRLSRDKTLSLQKDKPWLFLYTKQPWLKDRDVFENAKQFALEELRKNPMNFCRLVEELRKDPDVLQVMKNTVLDHYATNPTKLLYLPKTLWTDSDILNASLPGVLNTLSKNPLLFSRLPRPLRERQEVLHAARNGAKTLKSKSLFEKLPSKLQEGIFPPNSLRSQQDIDLFFTSNPTLDPEILNSEPFLFESLKTQTIDRLVGGDIDSIAFLPDSILKDPDVLQAIKESLLSGVTLNLSVLPSSCLDIEEIYSLLKTRVMDALLKSPYEKKSTPPFLFDHLPGKMQADLEIQEAAKEGILRNPDQYINKDFFRSKLLPLLLNDPHTPVFIKELVLQQLPDITSISSLANYPEILDSDVAQAMKQRLHTRLLASSVFTSLIDIQNLSDPLVVNAIKTAIPSAVAYGVPTQMSKAILENKELFTLLKQAVSFPPIWHRQEIGKNWPAQLQEDPEMIAKGVSMVTEKDTLPFQLFRKDLFWKNLLKNKIVFFAAQEAAADLIAGKIRSPFMYKAGLPVFNELDKVLQKSPKVLKIAKAEALQLVEKNPLEFHSLSFTLQKLIAQEAITQNPGLLEIGEDPYANHIFGPLVEEARATPGAWEREQNAKLRLLANNPEMFFLFSETSQKDPLLRKTAKDQVLKKVGLTPYLFETFPLEFLKEIAEEAFTDNPWLLMYVRRNDVREAFLPLAEEKSTLPDTEEKGVAAFKRNPDNELHLIQVLHNDYEKIPLAIRKLLEEKLKNAHPNFKPI